MCVAVLCCLLQSLFDHIPVGVGSQGIIPTTAKDLEAALEMGMDWSLRYAVGDGGIVGRSGMLVHGSDHTCVHTHCWGMVCCVVLVCCSEGYSWAEDKEHCEEYGRMLNADPTKVRGIRARRCSKHARALLLELLDCAVTVLAPGMLLLRASLPTRPHSSCRPSCVQVSARAKKRGLPQMGTLGAGNHYAEVQVVDEVYDQAAARKMGIDTIGQVRVGVDCTDSRVFGKTAQLRLALLRCSPAAS